MSVCELIEHHPLPLQETEAAKIIAKRVDRNLYFSIMLAISYGIILGKRQERERRRAHRETVDA